MTAGMDSAVVHMANEAADIKKQDLLDQTSWVAHLWADVPAAISYANSPPLSQAGTIVFNIRDNGQVWTYDLH
ncbi:hypothetical protein AB0L97_27325 [Nocardia sp. NPDC051911]|uniref:hypothetical protein n=1 Tax=Nocardia sp. NPDC051911 TaxID=3154648 RepID=UPI00342AE45F